MIVVGLTGSIGMGKSTAAAMFERQGAPVYDADAEVRRLYAAGGAAVAPVEAAFPGVIVDGGIDRGRLSERVVGNREALARLNGVVWPLMGAARANFLKRAREVGTALAVLDIPLLFETGGQGSVDVVVVVTASAAIQRERVMGRPGMNEEKFAAMLAAQTPDAEKRARADFIVDTGRGLAEAENQVRDIVDVLRGRAETAQ